MVWSEQQNPAAPRMYWLMDLPHDLGPTEDVPAGYVEQLENIRKRKFDNINDLCAEVCKRARRSPIKLGLLGNLAKKRQLADLNETEESDERNKQEGDERKKKMKEPAIAEAVLDAWMDELVSNFNKWFFGLGEVVPDHLQREPLSS